MSHLSERPVYIVDNSDHFLESLTVVPKEELERCEKLAKSMMVENIRRKDNGIRKIKSIEKTNVTSGRVLIPKEREEVIFDDAEEFDFETDGMLSDYDHSLDSLFNPEMPTMEEELASWPKRDKVKEMEELEQRYKELIDNASLQSDFDFG